MYFLKRYNKLILLFIAFSLQLNAQNFGLIEQQIGHLDGYVLFAPLETKTTYLINKCGELVHQWESKYKPGQSVYLLPNGCLLRAANDSNTAFISGGGRIEKFDWENKLIWSYKISDSLNCLHHDIYPMPNGNILAIVWEKKTKEQAIAAGRNPALVGNYVWNEKIIELKPKGKNEAEIVWYWDVWEHLVQDINPNLPNFGKISENQDKLNINYKASTNPDWLHFNAIVYNAELDEILVSNRNFNEIFIIKHLSKNQSSKSNNNIIFRWGNNEAFKNVNNLPQQLFAQHSPVWINNGLQHQGKIMVFNNGTGRNARTYSSVEIIEPKKIDDKYIEEENLKPIWRYLDTSSKVFYSKNVSNAQMLQKGHVFICEGASGRFFEIDERKNIVWEFVNPMSGKGMAKQGEMNETNRVFRGTFYPGNYKAFKGKNIKGISKLQSEQIGQICIPGQK